MTVFEFRDPGILADDTLELVLLEEHPGGPGSGRVPAYGFGIGLAGGGERVGYVELRVGSTEHIVKYAGHIGYRIVPGHRGHKYAARACVLLFPLARKHGFRTLWITCNPDNTASRRTCEIAGGEFAGIVDLPEDTDMYRRGERQKCRYRFDL